MMPFLLLIFLCAVVTVSAETLYVSSYSGNITSLSLNAASSGKYVLSTISIIYSSTPNPSWLTKNGNYIYVSNENFDQSNGSILALKTSQTGQLSYAGQPLPVPGGPVSMSLYNQGRALAVAHYGGSTVSNYNIWDNGTLSHLQTFTFNNPKGPHPRQDKAHPHQVILDPSDQFIVVPDLGTDMIRIFKIDKKTNRFTEQNSISVPAGYGPRHGAFLRTEDQPVNMTYFFLITELANKVLSYVVSSSDKSLEFSPIKTYDVLNMSPPQGLFSAELIISPDRKFLITTARNATVLSIPNPFGSGPNKIPSDTLQTWAINSSNGELAFQKLAPAGGNLPRHISLNANGTLAAVALQGDGRIVVYERDSDSGVFGKMVAWADVGSQPNTVIWG